MGFRTGAPSFLDALVSARSHRCTSVGGGKTDELPQLDTSSII